MNDVRLARLYFMEMSCLNVSSGVTSSQNRLEVSSCYSLNIKGVSSNAGQFSLSYRASNINKPRRQLRTVI